MSENPQGRDPDPARPSKAEGEAPEEEKPLAGPAEVQEPSVRAEPELNDPSFLLPAQAEGEGESKC